MSPRIPPRRSKRPFSIEEFVEHEEELARQQVLEERRFDPDVPPEHYAEPHHFAVNPTSSYNDWSDDVDAIIAEAYDQPPLSDEEQGEWRQAYEQGLEPDEFALIWIRKMWGPEELVSNHRPACYVVDYSGPGVDLVSFGDSAEDALEQIQAELARWGERFDESNVLGSQRIARGVFFGIGGDAVK